MIRLDLPIVGPAAAVLATMSALSLRHDRLALLLHGDPGVGKSHILELIARQLAGSHIAIEHVNGQSLGIDLVRSWRERGSGCLFSRWSVKRVDELDHASSSARAELLTYLDYLPANTAILASTNDYGRLRAESKGRLETRFKVHRVDAPSLDSAIAYLRRHFQIPAAAARAIALGAVPDNCLATEGVNFRACIEDAENYLAAVQASRAA